MAQEELAVAAKKESADESEEMKKAKKEPDEDEEAKKKAKKAGKKDSQAKRRESDDDDEKDDENDDDDDEEDDEKKKGKKAALSSGDLRAMAQTCQLAGKPELLAEFVAKGLTLAQAREALLAARTTESESQVVNSHVGPISTSTYSTIDQQAAAIAASKGVTKAQAYRTLLQQNPKLYEAYLEERDAAMLTQTGRRKYAELMNERFAR